MVQYFQRARFEYFPQFQGTQYDVQLQLLGDVLTVPRRPFPTSQAVDSGPAVRYFPEVQHTVRDVFLNYFNEKGALERFGYPISEEMQETNNDGQAAHTPCSTSSARVWSITPNWPVLLMKSSSGSSAIKSCVSVAC